MSSRSRRNDVLAVLSYVPDAAGRIVRRAEAGQPAARHGYSGPGDAPTFVTDDAGAVARRYVALLGGVSVTVTGQHQRWSYPNVHGDVMATADASGAKEGPTVVYTPDGHALGPVPDNLDGLFGYGWLGSHQRPTEHADGLAPVVQMGARPYLPSIGRFLAQDPVDGGSANAYDYVSGDPVNGLDLTGMAEQRPLPPGPREYCYRSDYPFDIGYNSDLCVRYREADRTGNPDIYYRYHDIDVEILTPGPVLPTILTVVSAGTGLAAIFTTPILPLSATLGATSAATGVAAQIVDARTPCRGERIAVALVLGGAGLAASAKPVTAFLISAANTTNGTAWVPPC